VKTSTVLASLQTTEDGPIDKKSFQKAMIEAGHQVYASDTVVDALWNALDINHDKSIDKKELLCGLVVLTGDDVDQKVQLGFKLFDLNSDGFVQKEELRLLLRNITKVKFSNSQDLEKYIEDFITRTFEKFDENKDGQLSFDEFKRAALEDEEVKSFFSLSGSDLA